MQAGPTPRPSKTLTPSQPGRPDPAAVAEFNEKFNVGYLDPNLGPASFAQVAKHYAASALLYGAMLAFFFVNPWFRSLLSISFGKHTAFQIYLYGYAAYLIIAPLIFFIFRPRSLWTSKNLLILGYLKRFARKISGQGKAGEGWAPTYMEKHALAFFLIKAFYGPQMINSALLEYNSWPQLLVDFRMDRTLFNHIDKGYLFFVSGIFFLDSMLFIMGYHTESGLLRNRLRYAETKFWHIIVCLACYGPLNMATSALLLDSNQSPYILFRGDIMHPLTWILRGLAVVFLLLLTSASLSLFTKASNLTNRGIVDWGPYRYIRHPGYLAKNMFWLMTLIPVFFPNTADPRFSWPNFLAYAAATIMGFIGWGSLYFLRAITEERFLSRDPDYVAYCQRVKYRFIPGVY
jgi:protein-S-isoprenylcysteine O-methyltransferase Ste14